MPVHCRYGRNVRTAVKFYYFIGRLPDYGDLRRMPRSLSAGASDAGGFLQSGEKQPLAGSVARVERHQAVSGESPMPMR